MASVQDIYDEITRIDNAKQGITEAIEEKGVQVPENAKIQELPPLIRSIPTDVTEIFWAEYGVTTYQQIIDAMGANKLVLVSYSARVYVITAFQAASIVFSCAQSFYLYRVSVNSSDVWSSNSYTMEVTTNRVTEVNENSDNNHYPSAKAVYDAIVSGKQVFWAEYGTTTYNEVLAAYNAGKIPMVVVSGQFVEILSRIQTNVISFACQIGTFLYRAELSSDDNWQHIILGNEINANKVDTIVGNEESTTEYPNTKAVYDFVVANKQIFWATYGTTTAAEIDVAVAAGKFVICLYNNQFYTLARSNENYYYLSFYMGTGGTFLRVSKTTNNWDSFSSTLQSLNRVQTLQGYETNEEKYPSTKAVADALGKWGVVSQTLQWYGIGDNAQDYRILNPVQGLIPQSNIDLYKEAGAVFNPDTGYFELNELTDIAYDEMQRIYTRSIGAFPFSTNRNSQFAQYPERTTVKIFFPAGYSTSINHFFAYSGYIRHAYLQGCNNLAATQNSFANCPRLKKIIGAIAATSFNDVVFQNCWSLEDVSIAKLRSNIWFSQSSKLTLASVVYLVDEATNTATITVTLHATAYARCQADTTEYTYNGQTYTGIIAYAAAKNITIQSA